MIEKLIPVLCFLPLLASCAGTGQPLAGGKRTSSVGAPVVSRSETVTAEPLEKVVATISPDVLYLLLSAEIAGQRGDLTVALDNYLEAARTTRDPRVAERAVQVALFVKDKDAALEALSIWLAADPDSDSARKVSVLLHLQQGQSREAAAQIKALLARQDGNFESTVLEIVRLLDKEAPDDALQIMGEVVDAFPDRAEAHFAYAGLALGRNRLQLALEQVRMARALRPDWRRALLLQAEIVVAMGDPSVARELFGDALDAAPDDVQLRTLYAQYLVKAEQYGLAEKQFQRIVSEQPDNHDALFALALVRLQLHQYTSAQMVFRRLLEVPKWADQARLYLGRIAAENGRVDEALQWFDRAAHGSVGLEAGLNAVSLAASHKRLGEAHRRLRALRERFPREALRFYLVEAEILNSQKDYKAAFSLLTNALRELPGQPELLYSRALTAERLGRLDILEADLKTLLKSNPDDANALNALGYTLADRTQRYEESHRYLTRALQLRPDDPVIIDSYGWLQYRLGHYEQALEYLRRAYRLEPDPEIAAHLGEVLWVMGRRAEAQSVWKAVLEEHPGNSYIHRVRIRLMGADED